MSKIGEKFIEQMNNEKSIILFCKAITLEVDRVEFDDNIRIYIKGALIVTSNEIKAIEKEFNCRFTLVNCFRNSLTFTLNN